MEAITPDATCRDAAGECLHLMHIACPDTGTQPIEGIVGDFQCFGLTLECRHTQDGAEDFFLENAHLVIALE